MPIGHFAYLLVVDRRLRLATYLLLGERVSPRAAGRMGAGGRHCNWRWRRESLCVRCAWHTVPPACDMMVTVASEKHLLAVGQ